MERGEQSGALVAPIEKSSDNSAETMAELDLFRVYMREVVRTPLLNAEEEVELAKDIEAGLLAEQVLRVRAGCANEIYEELLTTFQTHNGKNHMPLTTDPVGSAEVAIVGLEKLAVREDIYDDELRELAAQGGRAFDHFVNANLRLVVSMANRNVRRGLDVQDVIQLGNLGLMHGLEKFDYTKGHKFSTYASKWVRQAINRGIGETGRTIALPIKVFESVIRVKSARARLYATLGIDPTPEQIAEEENIRAAGFNSAKVAELLEISYQLPSLDELTDPSSPSSLRREHVAGGANTEHDALARVESEELVQILTQLLDDTCLAVLIARSGMAGPPQSFLEIAGRMRISDNSARRLYRKATMLLRENETIQLLHQGSSGSAE